MRRARSAAGAAPGGSKGRRRRCGRSRSPPRVGWAFFASSPLSRAAGDALLRCGAPACPMADAPLISCIVPAFNSARYVRAALESILAQTHRPLQIVVADDGSADETVAIAGAVPWPVEVVDAADGGAGGDSQSAACAPRAVTSSPFSTPMTSGTRRSWRDRGALRGSARARRLSQLRAVGLDRRARRGGRRASAITRARRPSRATPPRPCWRVAPCSIRRRLRRPLVVRRRHRLVHPRRRAGLRIEMLPDVLTYHRMHRANLTRRRPDASREEFLDVIKRSLDRRRSARETPIQRLVGVELTVPAEALARRGGAPARPAPRGDRAAQQSR